MRKRVLSKLFSGTAEYVIAHAKLRQARGKQPSMSFSGEKNPKKALKLALTHLNNYYHMTRQEYLDVLRRLPIVSPTREDMALLCPHLEPDTAVRAFTESSGYVPVPSVFVRYCVNVLSYQKAWIEEIKEWQKIDGKDVQVVVGTKKHEPRITHAFVNRSHSSYANGRLHGDVRTVPEFVMVPAIDFAENNWGSELVVDDWVDVLTIYVQDPSDLFTDRYHRDYPRTKAVLYVALNRKLNELINDHSKPESELFDDAIAHMTLDHFSFDEIRGGRGGYTEFNCAYCGSGLGLSACGGCGHTFRDDQFRCGWSTPLSRKMVDFLRQSGHVFPVDPEQAWRKERERWEEWQKNLAQQSQATG